MWGEQIQCKSIPVNNSSANEMRENYASIVGTLAAQEAQAKTNLLPLLSYYHHNNCARSRLYRQPYCTLNMAFLQAINSGGYCIRTDCTTRTIAL